MRSFKGTASAYVLWGLGAIAVTGCAALAGDTSRDGESMSEARGADPQRVGESVAADCADTGGSPTVDTGGSTSAGGPPAGAGDTSTGAGGAAPGAGGAASAGGPPSGEGGAPGGGPSPGTGGTAPGGGTSTTGSGGSSGTCHCVCGQSPGTAAPPATTQPPYEGAAPATPGILPGAIPGLPGFAPPVGVGGPIFDGPILGGPILGPIGDGCDCCCPGVTWPVPPVAPLVAYFTGIAFCYRY